MIASMTIAGIAGAFIPIMMSRLGQDPATSSTIVLTTVTDVMRVLFVPRNRDAAVVPALDARAEQRRKREIDAVCKGSSTPCDPTSNDQ